MDMDDHQSHFQISRVSKALVLLGVALVIALFSFFYSDSRKQQLESEEIADQFNRFSGAMRHNFKIANLNHKAFDAYLLALVKQDETIRKEAENYLKASLGFMFVGYIDSRPFRDQVRPHVEKALGSLQHYNLSTAEDAVSDIRSHFQSVFETLAQLEKDTYEGVQQLYTRQQLFEKKRRNLYKMLVVSAVVGLAVIAVMAIRQFVLIGTLRRNEKELKAHIEERKNAEKEKLSLTEQLHQAKKMESIGLMAGGVAHDLNNILSGIVGYPELLLKTLPDDSTLRKPLMAINESGVRAALVVEDLLTVARGVATAKENHNVNELVKEYFKSPEFLKLQSHHPQVEFTYKLHAAPCYIYCSPVHIKKCIMNLITNGAEAITAKGSVLLTTDKPERLKAQEENSELDPGLDYICLTVSDSGAGISDHDLKHIFDPFYSKKVMGRSGTGLGLTVVWNTVQDHSGRVIVKNNESGTSVQLWFPMSGDDTSQYSLSDESVESFGGREHILVVDDEFHIRDICCEMLKSMGYSVDSVASGEGALAFLEENPVDLVILDMLMDPGMNGYQTYIQILKKNPEQKAIVASGYSESDHVRRCLREGASQFLKKPYSMDQLGRAVKSALAS